jgi:DNA-directed RNA polymerase alpha subunit
MNDVREPSEILFNDVAKELLESVRAEGFKEGFAEGVKDGYLQGLTRARKALDQLPDGIVTLPPDFKIEDFNFTVRTYNFLKRGDIHTIADLVQKTEDQLRDLRNFSDKSMDEIMPALTEAGYSLRQE